ncbi:MAG TPA: BamA/TamA family outer membrane protein, partial [Myxococcota bacterium]|nr:BamA/TamA family outer membrane protein [Myxococcota bacterium]
DYVRARQQNQFELEYPHGTLEAVLKSWHPVDIKIGLDYQYNRAGVFPGSRVDQDLRSGAILGRGDFGVYTVSTGLIWDSRDSETSPSAGAHHNISARIVPGSLTRTPYTYAGVNGSLRNYFGIWRQHVVLATRLVGDVLTGDVPFFSLAESEDGYAVGGGRGVRGVPAQRYYGKVKTYGNVELRIQFPSLNAFDQELILGVVGFADGGRVWADLRPDPNLDGRGPGLKYGVGGGLRVQLGETFLVRGDAAWSPDADPIAFYFNVGQVF